MWETLQEYDLKTLLYYYDMVALWFDGYVTIEHIMNKNHKNNNEPINIIFPAIIN